jgi:uncharacterized protein YoaH (UPF0181 family)
MARSTKVETEHRINAIYKLLSQGYSRGQVVQFCAEKWGVSDRQSDTYMQRAREKLLEDCEMERPAWIAEALQRLRTYEQAAFKEKQNQTAINSVQAQARLIGIEL